VSIVRIVFGAFLFFGGAMWLLFTVLDRWWFPVPPSPTPKDLLAGNLLFIDLLMMVSALIGTYLHTNVFTNPRMTIVEALNAEDEEQV